MLISSGVLWPRRIGPIIALAGALLSCSDGGTTQPDPDESPQLGAPVLVGGAGDQAITSLATDGSSLYVAGSGDGYIIRFDLSDATVAWRTDALAGARFYGIAASNGTSFAAGIGEVGESGTPGVCGAVDGVGDPEAKTLAAAYDDTGAQIDCSSESYYPYSGFEQYRAAGSVGGLFFAGGFAQEGFSSTGPFVLARYSAGGVFEEAVTEPGSVLGSSTCCQGESRILQIDQIDGDVLTAGWSRMTALGEDDVARPAIMRYTTALDRAWKARSPDRTGQFHHAAEAAGSIYAVGETGDAPNRSFLIEKYDMSGARQWSVVSGSTGDNVLTGVVGLSDRIFAVGYTTASGAGGQDVVVVEVDAASGAFLSTTNLGGPENDSAVGLISDGSSLWVAGTSRSFTSAEGNEVGEAEIFVWRVPLP